MATKNTVLIKDLKSKYPTIWKTTRTSIETAVEIQNKKGAFAFLNNALSFGLIAGDLKELTAESVAFNEDPKHRQELKNAINEEFNGEEVGLLEIIFEHVVPLIFMNIGGGLALGKAIKEYNEQKA